MCNVSIMINAKGNLPVADESMPFAQPVAYVVQRSLLDAKKCTENDLLWLASNRFLSRRSIMITPIRLHDFFVARPKAPTQCLSSRVQLDFAFTHPVRRFAISDG